VKYKYNVPTYLYKPCLHKQSKYTIILINLHLGGMTLNKEKLWIEKNILIKN